MQNLKHAQDLLVADQEKHWTLPMEIEKDSPDGVMFELSFKELVRVCQAEEGKRAW